MSFILPDSIKDFISRLSPCPERVYNLGGSAIALFLALREMPFLMVESDEEQAETLFGDILFFQKCAGLREDVVFLSAPDSASSASQRAKACRALSLSRAPLITFKDAIHSPLWSPDELNERTIHLRKSGEYDRVSLHERLERMGYVHVPLVSERGRFSARQWILDIFPPTEESPVRVEFFGDVIESLRTFDIEGQRSLSDIGEILIYPSKEPASGINVFSLTEGYETFVSEAIAGDMPAERPDSPAKTIVTLTRFAIAGGGSDAGVIPIRGLGILPEERKDISGLSYAVERLAHDTRIMFVSSSMWQAERLKDILKDGGVIAPIIKTKDAFAYEGQVFISVGGLSAGFYIPGMMVLTERELFRRPPYRAIKRSKVSGLIASLDDLKEGDYVVHKDYGIGRFTGLVKQTVEGHECDLMVIEYGGGARLYLPLEGIGRVGKYHSAEGVVPKMDSLGTKSWQKTKESVKKKVRELADKLLKLYAERELTKGFAFSEDTEVHREFDSFFIYEETPDQSRAIEEIKKDMASERPMDRLLCGDVGYGKTEVAMRAAFRAVYDGKQVAVIVPTTLLCEQHFRTFRGRFSAFPVRIDYISRFKGAKERKETLGAVSRGEVDIVIGTHALLRKDMAFANLGLLIIDEEHRFGVAQKEKIKELKKGVDVLSLSATPIPRTLQMAVSGIRAMSVIETPPEERLAVKTIVSAFGPDVIREAVAHELERGGQVFFVHNRIKDIGKISDYVARLVPELRISVAHGRTPERELERIMLGFLDGKIDVLVSTAIIGAGLDITNANTIIINMADRMGLADLYQLRGRVGRGREKAHAFFLIPGAQAITEEALKRLQAIQELSYLGAGLRLAMKDLEIRGAGNMLGPEQSGYMEAVGFDMYIELLEEAVADIKGMKVKEEVEPRISLPINALLPEDYIEDTMLRLSAYRKIASAESAEALSAVEAELRDRFGPLPDEALTLLGIAGLKIAARRLSIAAITQGRGSLRFTFVKEAEVPAERLIEGFGGGGLRFYPDGFELSVKGDVLGRAADAIKTLELLSNKNTGG